MSGAVQTHAVSIDGLEFTFDTVAAIPALSLRPKVATLLTPDMWSLMLSKHDGPDDEHPFIIALMKPEFVQSWTILMSENAKEDESIRKTAEDRGFHLFRVMMRDANVKCHNTVINPDAAEVDQIRDVQSVYKQQVFNDLFTRQWRRLMTLVFHIVRETFTEP